LTNALTTAEWARIAASGKPGIDTPTVEEMFASLKLANLLIHNVVVQADQAAISDTETELTRAIRGTSMQSFVNIAPTNFEDSTSRFYFLL
jgi:hypothetical protein